MTIGRNVKVDVDTAAEVTIGKAVEVAVGMAKVPFLRRFDLLPRALVPPVVEALIGIAAAAMPAPPQEHRSPASIEW
jgi:hypothetical protein